MKKWRKPVILISIGMAVTGLILMICGWMMGGSFRKAYEGYHGILNLGGFDFIEEEKECGQPQGFPFPSKQVDGIEIKIDKGNIIWKKNHGNQIQVQVQDNRKTQVYMDGDTLIIDGNGNWFSGKNDVTIMMPDDQSLAEVKMDLGAGKMKTDDIQAETVEVNLDAGQFISTGEIRATSSTWEVGTGQMDLSYLDSEELSMECDIGQIKARLEGQEEDYCVETDCGVGRIQFGRYQTDMMEEEISMNEGKRSAELNCGVGEIKITF